MIIGSTVICGRSHVKHLLYGGRWTRLINGEARANTLLLCIMTLLYFWVMRYLRPWSFAAAIQTSTRQLCPATKWWRIWPVCTEEASGRWGPGQNLLTEYASPTNPRDVFVLRLVRDALKMVNKVIHYHVLLPFEQCSSAIFFAQRKP